MASNKPSQRAYHSERFPLAELPGSLPKLQNPLPGGLEPSKIIQQVLDSHLPDLSEHHLTEDALFRDMLSLTGTLRTFNSPEIIVPIWTMAAVQRKISHSAVIPSSARQMNFMPGGPTCAWLQGRFTFDLEIAPGVPAKGSGLIRLVPDEDGATAWKIWTLTTMLEEVDGWGNPDVLSPVHSNGTSNGTLTDGFQSSPRLLRPLPAPHVYSTLIVGSGLAGLSMLGRLAASQISDVLVVDRHVNVGENWSKSRYDSVKLHTAKDYGHLPFERTFGDEYDYFLTGKDLAKEYDGWVDRFGLRKNILGGWVVERAHWDTEGEVWDVTLKKTAELESQNGENGLTNGHNSPTASVWAKHLVFATGSGGQVPKSPHYEHRERFQGQVLHSVSYRNARAWMGLKCVVIGTANTAFDVADDMVLAGASSVTLVQRSITQILPISSYRIIFDHLYNNKIPTEVSDREGMLSPLKIQRELGLKGLVALSKRPELKQYWEGWNKSGFRADPNVDIFHLIYERAGGHYLDVGAGAKVIDGSIKVKSGVLPTEWTQKGLKFEDGSEIEADVVVFATGFKGDMRDDAIAVVGEDIGRDLEGWWGLDAGGEVRGIARETGREFHPSLMFPFAVVLLTS